MRTIIQRVKSASVLVDGKKVAEIGIGLLLLLGIEDEDNEDDINWLSRKIANLRIFDDKEGVINLSVLDIQGKILVVSQFTLHASTKKGNRPSFLKAAKPEIAVPIYEKFIIQLEKEVGQKIQTGIFGAMMDVHLINSGPVTISIDTKNKE